MQLSSRQQLPCMCVAPSAANARTLEWPEASQSTAALSRPHLYTSSYVVQATLNATRPVYQQEFGLGW
jgi:hypothetical protein